MAGVLLGPFTPVFVANAEIAAELAEIGVMLLMFGVGLHFSLDDLLVVRKIALPGAALQIIVATALGASVAATWGWGWGGSLVFGLALSVASTVVLLRALESHGALESINGRIAVGWLVVEDLAMVLVLVLLPPLAGWLGGNTPDRLGAVSYTHLDVYKRQLVKTAPVLDSWGVGSPRSVSYTHLDVYKRQSRTASPGRAGVTRPNTVRY